MLVATDQAIDPAHTENHSHPGRCERVVCGTDGSVIVTEQIIVQLQLPELCTSHKYTQKQQYGIA